MDDQTIEDTSTESADYDYFVANLVPHRPKVITGAPEAAGGNASGHQHALYDGDYVRPLVSHTWKPEKPVHCKEAHEYACEYSERAAKEITTYTPPKYRIIRPSMADKAHRIGASESAWMNAIRDHSEQKYVQYDRAGRALQGSELVSDQRARSGHDGTVDTVEEYTYEYAPDTYGTQGGGPRGHPGDLQSAEGCVYWAAELADRPPACLQLFFKSYPQASIRMRELLDEIGDMAPEDIGPGEVKIVSSIVRRALEFSDVYRIYDPMMLEFVVPGDKRYINLGNIKANYVRIHRLLVGEYQGDIPPEVGQIIMPLAVHMWERNLPVTVENVEDEAQALLDVREEVARLATSASRQHRLGGVEEVLALANKQSLSVLNQVDGATIRCIFREVAPEAPAGLLYPEMLMDLPSSTQCQIGGKGGPRPVQGVTTSGYGKALGPSKSSSSSSTLTPSQYAASHTSSQPVYNPMFEKGGLSKVAHRSWYR